jgi:type II secretory pathway pseudopilin PulG
MKTRLCQSRQCSGVTLIETVIAMLVVAVTIAATVNGYILSSNRAEWSSQSLAAHSLAMQKLEQVRAADWDLTRDIPVDLATEANFPTTNAVLDLPISGSNVVTATLYTSIKTVSTSPPLKMVRVDCVWPYRERGFFTNTIMTYLSPEQ